MLPSLSSSCAVSPFWIHQGLAWFGYPSSDNVAHGELVECSNMGVCSTIGECSCNDGFFGSACEYMGCSLGSSGGGECSGHGSCLSIKDLALKQVTPVTYGNDPNKASTWDADRIYGCSCDDGYEGQSCSLRTCPVGVDPVTGDSDLLTCSNHGLCDHGTGKCVCFAGWGSSDGSGGLGSKHDCGHRLQLRGYP